MDDRARIPSTPEKLDTVEDLESLTVRVTVLRRQLEALRSKISEYEEDFRVISRTLNAPPFYPTPVDLVALNLTAPDRERADAWVALWIVRGVTELQKRLALTSGWDRLP